MGVALSQNNEIEAHHNYNHGSPNHEDDFIFKHIFMYSIVLYKIVVFRTIYVTCIYYLFYLFILPFPKISFYIYVRGLCLK